MIGVLLFLGIIGLVFTLASWTTISYKWKADKLGVKISWVQVFGQRIRKTLTLDILEAAAIAATENLPIDVEQLEIHKLSGGDPLKVVNEIVEHKRKGKVLEYRTATTLDLGGEELGKLWQESNEK